MRAFNIWPLYNELGLLSVDIRAISRATFGLHRKFQLFKLPAEAISGDAKISKETLRWIRFQAFHQIHIRSFVRSHGDWCGLRGRLGVETF